MPRKKICWNCEGNVSVHEENCPYCAVYLGPAEPKEEEETHAPPYKMEKGEEVPDSPYREGQGEDSSLDEDFQQEGSPRQVAYSLLLLSGGTLLFFFGLVLWLFSVDGTLTLKWSGNYWYVYFLASLPFLLFGWNKMQQLDS